MPKLSEELLGLISFAKADIGFSNVIQKGHALLDSNLRHELAIYDHHFNSDYTDNFKKVIQGLKTQLDKLRTKQRDETEEEIRKVLLAASIDKIQGLVANLRADLANPAFHNREEWEESAVMTAKLMNPPIVQPLNFSGSEVIKENPRGYVFKLNNCDPPVMILAPAETAHALFPNRRDVNFVIGLVECETIKIETTGMFLTDALVDADTSDNEVFDVIQGMLTFYGEIFDPITIQIKTPTSEATSSEPTLAEIITIQRRDGITFDEAKAQIIKEATTSNTILNANNLDHLMLERCKAAEARSISITLVAESTNLQDRDTVIAILDTIPFEDLAGEGVEEFVIDLTSCNTIGILEILMDEINRISSENKVKISVSAYNGYIFGNRSFAYVSNGQGVFNILKAQGAGGDDHPSMSVDDAMGLFRDLKITDHPLKSSIAIEFVGHGVSLLVADNPQELGTHSINLPRSATTARPLSPNLRRRGGFGSALQLSDLAKDDISAKQDAPAEEDRRRMSDANKSAPSSPAPSRIKRMESSGGIPLRRMESSDSMPPQSPNSDRATPAGSIRRIDSSGSMPPQSPEPGRTLERTSSTGEPKSPRSILKRTTSKGPQSPTLSRTDSGSGLLPPSTLRRSSSKESTPIPQTSETKQPSRQRSSNSGSFTYPVEEARYWLDAANTSASTASAPSSAAAAAAADAAAASTLTPYTPESPGPNTRRRLTAVKKKLLSPRKTTEELPRGQCFILEFDYRRERGQEVDQEDGTMSATTEAAEATEARFRTAGSRTSYSLFDDDDQEVAAVKYATLEAGPARALSSALPDADPTEATTPTAATPNPNPAQPQATAAAQSELGEDLGTSPA